MVICSSQEAVEIAAHLCCRDPTSLVAKESSVGFADPVITVAFVCIFRMCFWVDLFSSVSLLL